MLSYLTIGVGCTGVDGLSDVDFGGSPVLRKKE